LSTPASDIYDIFVNNQITDFRLNTLFQTSGSVAFGLYLQPWLLEAIDIFDVCTQDLTFDKTTQTFSQTLTQKHINMLAQFMVLPWLRKEVQDVLQMRIKIQGGDLRTASENLGLREKRETLKLKREEIDHLLTEYSYKNNNWSDWRNQNFAG
jgi:hypothetical protein